MDPNGKLGDWFQYGRYILSEIKRLDKNEDKLEKRCQRMEDDRLRPLETSQARLKVQVGLLWALFGSVAAKVIHDWVAMKGGL